MVKIIEAISEDIKDLRPVYLKEVFDFVQYLKEKQKMGDDTQYLSSIPGMVDSILEEDSRPIKEYTKKIEW
jgi:hypothetical protein